MPPKLITLGQTVPLPLTQSVSSEPRLPARTGARTGGRVVAESVFPGFPAVASSLTSRHSVVGGSQPPGAPTATHMIDGGVRFEVPGGSDAERPSPPLSPLSPLSVAALDGGEEDRSSANSFSSTRYDYSRILLKSFLEKVNLEAGHLSFDSSDDELKYWQNASMLFTGLADSAPYSVF